MKQSVQGEVSQVSKVAGPTRSRPAQYHTVAHANDRTQLSAMINSSPRVQALAQMKEDIQGSARVQNLQQLAEQIQPGTPAQLRQENSNGGNTLEHQSSLNTAEGFASQLKIGIAGTLAHSDRLAEIDDATEDHGSSATESQSSCGCGSTQGTGAGRTSVQEIKSSPRVQVQRQLAFEINKRGAVTGQPPVAQPFTGPFCGSGIVQRTKVAQLGRNENLNHQFEIEETLFSKGKRAKFIKEFSALIVQVQETFPELAELDAAAVSGARYDQIQTNFHAATMDNDALNSNTETAYKPLVAEQRQSALQRLSIPGAETVAGRAGDWKAFKEFRPQLNPLNLLLGPEVFAGLKAETEKKIQARRWLASEVPEREDFIGRTLKSFTFTGQQPSPDIAKDAGEFYDNAKEQIGVRYQALDKAASSESFEGEIKKIHAELVVPLKTSPGKGAVGGRLKAVSEAKGGEQIKGFALASPDFELRMANLKLQNQALDWLASNKKPQAFHESLKKLYPGLFEVSPALRADAEQFFQEQMALAQGWIKAILLNQPDEEYRRKINELVHQEISPLFDVPKTPRQFVSGPLSGEPLSKLYGKLADELVADKNIKVVGALYEREVKLIKRAVGDHFDLSAASEKRVVVTIPAETEEEKPLRLNVSLAMDEEGAITASVVTRGGFNVPDAISAEPDAKVLGLKEALISKYSLGGFEEEGVPWALADLARLQQALGLLPPEDLPVLKGLVLVRAASLDKDEEHEQGRTLGLYSGKASIRKIKLANIAFAKDLDAFSKRGPRDIQPASYLTILHEIAHAIDKHAMLEAQKERDDAFRQVNQNFLQSDPVVEEAEKWEGEASEAEGQIALLSLEIAMKLNEKIRVAGQGVEGEFLSAAREFYLAGQVSAKAPLEDHDQQYVDARKKLQGAGKQANPWPDLAEKLSSVDKFVIQFVKASRWLKQKAEEIQNAKKKSKAEDVSRKENLAGKEENLKEASAQSPKLKDKSRRLENFVAFVEKYAISPKITPYSEQSWKEGKYGEFFAEAYSLFLAEPEFLRKNYQPLFLYFQTGKHRK